MLMVTRRWFHADVASHRYKVENVTIGTTMEETVYLAVEILCKRTRLAPSDGHVGLDTDIWAPRS